MIRLLCCTFLCLAVNITYCQTAVFNDFNFEEGGYALVALRSKAQKNSLADSLDYWYTDDVAVLNEFKKEWVFNVPGKMRACGYHYEIVLTKNGLPLKYLYLNIDCAEIVVDKSYFYFDAEKLRKFKNKVKKLRSVEKTFETVQEARNYRNNILKNSTLLLVEAPLWTKYDGMFEFGYYCKNPEVCLGNWKAFEQLFREELESHYPNEKFELKLNGGYEHDIYLQVVCNKNLGQIYKLHNRDPAKEAWEPYKDIQLTSWWKAD